MKSSDEDRSLKTAPHEPQLEETKPEEKTEKLKPLSNPLVEASTTPADPSPKSKPIPSPDPLVFEADLTDLELPAELWVLILGDVDDALSLCSVLQASKALRCLATKRSGLLTFTGDAEKLQNFPRITGLPGISSVVINDANLNKDALTYFPNLTSVLLTTCIGADNLKLPKGVNFVGLHSCKLRSLNFLKTEAPLRVQLHQMKLAVLPLIERQALASNLSSVVELDLADAAISLEDIVAIFGIPSLRSLKRESGIWTGDIRRALSNMTNLEELVIGPVDDYLFENIVWENFQRLEKLELHRNYQFNGLTHTNSAIEYLKKCPAACLKTLTIVQPREHLQDPIQALLEGTIDNLEVSFVDACLKDQRRMPCNQLPHNYDSDYKRKLR